MGVEATDEGPEAIDFDPRQGDDDAYPAVELEPVETEDGVLY